MSPTGLVAFPITPMNEAGVVDVQALRSLVRRLVDGGVDGVCVLGSTGSYPYLSRDERRRAVEAAAEEIGGRIPLLAGVGSLRTDLAVLHSRDARAAGAEVSLLAAIAYTPLTEDEIFEHFRIVAEEGEIPVCVYDNPVSTNVRISEPLLQRLMAIPRIIGVKLPGPSLSSHPRSRVALLKSLAPRGFSVGFSGDAHAPAAILAGADAWHSALAGLFPAPALAISGAAKAGEVKRLGELLDRLEPLLQLSRDYGAIRVIYAAANIRGITDAQPPRPILPLPTEGCSRLRGMLDELAGAAAWT